MPIDRQPDGLNGNSLAVFPYKCARTCSCHRRGKGLISAASFISTGCRPSRIASTISGQGLHAL